MSRSEYSHVDSLAILASAINFQFRCEIAVKHILKLSIHKLDEEVLYLDLSLGWREPMINFLKDRILPDDNAEASS